MRKKTLSIILTSSILFTNSSIFASENSDLINKINKMENMIEDLKGEVEDLRANDEMIEDEVSLESAFKFNGYMDAYYTFYSGSKNQNQNNGFRTYRFALIPNQQVNDKFRWLSEIEFEDTPRVEAEVNTNEVTSDSSGKIFLERVYLQYDYNQYLKFRLGRDFAHSTVWSDNHYPTFVLNESRPMLERNIFPQVNDGLEVLGNAMLGNVGLDYVVYMGNGNSYVSHNDINDDDLYGARVRFTLPFLSFTRLSLAVADGYTSDKVVNYSYDKTAFGIGLEQKWNNFGLKAQYALANIKEDIKYDREGYYVQLSYAMDKFTPWIQYESYDVSNKDNISALKRKAFGLQYSLYSNLKLKLIEYMMDEDKQTLLVGTYHF